MRFKSSSRNWNKNENERYLATWTFIQQSTYLMKNSNIYSGLFSLWLSPTRVFAMCAIIYFLIAKEEKKNSQITRFKRKYLFFCSYDFVVCIYLTCYFLVVCICLGDFFLAHRISRNRFICAPFSLFWPRNILTVNNYRKLQATINNIWNKLQIPLLVYGIYGHHRFPS